MAIANYLAKIKSSGVYRYVFDKSEIPASQRNSLRLVVGYSERGPFNTPVYISDAQEFIATFGNISRRMERKGVFFHRLAIQALEAGPILALNIKPFKNESAKMISFNASDIVCDGEMDVIIPADSITLFAFNNENKAIEDGGKQVARHFLKPVPDYIEDGDTFKFVGNRYTETQPEYDKTADTKIVPDKEYFTKSGSGDTITYTKVANPVVGNLNTYYEVTGYKITGGPTHIRTIESGVEYYWKPAAASSIVAPAFGDDGTFVPGHYVYDHTYFNDDFIENNGGKIKVGGKQPDLQTAIMDDALIALDGTNTAGERWSTIYDTNRFWKVTDNLMDITPLVAGGSAKKDYMRIVQTSSKEDSVTIFMRPVIPAGYNIKISDWYASEVSEEMPAYMEAIKDHYLSEFFMEIYVFRGDLRSPDLFTADGTLGAHVRQVGNPSQSIFYPFCDVTGKGVGAEVRTNPDFLDPFGRPADALAAMADVSTSNFVGRYQGIMFPSFKDTTGSFISIDSVFNADYNAHKCLMAMNEQLLDDAYEADLNDNGEYDEGTEQTPTNPESSPKPGASHVGSVADLIHQLCSSVHSRVSGSGVKYDDYGSVASVPVNASVVGYYLEGYNYTTILKNESGRNLVEDKIYSVLGYKGIYEALTNNVDVDYKYWIDTFQGYPGVSMKSTMSAIVKQKFNALAILNFPPMVDCAVHMGYPGLTGGFDMNDVVKRGSGITLPAEVQGASWAAFFTQLQMTDGTNKFIVPSAALVSNLFMNKWSTRLPYYIVAGPNHGRIDYPGVVGTDYNYARPDLDALEPFGVNAIVYIPRKGFVINSNQTAKQAPVSALSKIHVRELVTFLQDSIEDMLYNYQWELNTPTLRDNVKAKAEVILGLIKANGGIYDFRVVCDETNNTPETIDNEMLIVDIEVEPSRGSGKMVQTLTIHRTGGIAASPRN